jgi:hypothetical protein
MSTTQLISHRGAGAPEVAAVAGVWNDLVGAMPIVIFWRAARELFRQRAHRRAVLAAFRR